MFALESWCTLVYRSLNDSCFHSCLWCLNDIYNVFNENMCTYIESMVFYRLFFAFFIYFPLLYLFSSLYVWWVRLNEFFSLHISFSMCFYFQVNFCYWYPLKKHNISSCFVYDFLVRINFISRRSPIPRKICLYKITKNHKISVRPFPILMER